MTRRADVALALSLAMLGVPAVAGESAPIDATLDVNGRSVFIGQSEGQATWVGSLSDARLGHRPQTLHLEAHGEGSVVVYTYATVRSEPGTPVVGYQHYREPTDREPRPVPPMAGEVRIEGAGPHASIRLIPADPVAVPVSGSFDLDVYRDLHDILSRQQDAEPPEDSAASFPRPGGTLAPILLPEEGFRGRLVVTDAVVRWSDQVADLRWTEQGAGIPGAGGAATLQTSVLHVDGTFRVAPLGDDGWTHSILSLDAVLDGDLLLHNAQGEGEVNGTSLPPGLQQIQVDGRMAGQADYGAAPARWTLRGEAAFVAVNAAAVHGSSSGAQVAVAVGLAAVALAVIAKLARVLLAGLNVASPLGNDQRRRVLATVARQPGIDQSGLARATQLARGTVRHHLTVLKRADLITERPLAGRATYTLNDSSYEFQVAPGATAAEAMARLHHPLRKALFDALARLGSADYEALRDDLARQGLRLPREAASYHLGLLRRHGLVERRRSGRAVVWQPRLDRQAVAATQRHRLLTGSRYGRVVAVLGDAGSTARQVRAKLREMGERWSVVEVDERLEYLRTIGLAKETALPRGKPGR